MCTALPGDNPGAPLPAARAGTGAERGAAAPPAGSSRKREACGRPLHLHQNRQSGTCARPLGTRWVRPSRVSTGTPPQPDQPPLPRSWASRFRCCTEDTLTPPPRRGHARFQPVAGGRSPLLESSALREPWQGLQGWTVTPWVPLPTSGRGREWGTSVGPSGGPSWVRGSAPSLQERQPRSLGSAPK